MNKKQKKLKVINFLQKHSELYAEFLSKSIKKKITYGYHCDTDQVYSHLKLKYCKNTPYYKFAKSIKNYFNINSDTKILEISSGKIPILSSILRNYTKSVTALNTSFVFQEYKNINLIQAEFNCEFSLENYDLIVGYRPCEATEDIINQCFKYKRDFAIYFCPCLGGKFESEFENAKIWRDSLIQKVMQNTNYEFAIVNIKGMFDKMPILFAKHKIFIC